MPYVGKKPADIIATAVDTTTGKFSGEIDAASLDISGNIDVDGTTNLDVVDIDGAVDMASTLQVDGNITSSGFMTITTTGNNDQITLVSTDADANSGPHLALYRNSSSPADNDTIGGVKFFAENDNDEAIQYATISGIIRDASDGSEDAELQFQVRDGGSNREFLRMTGSTGIVINEEGEADLDFRVESDGNANMLFVDASENAVLFGTTTNGTTADGTAIRATGEVLMTRTNAQPLLVNRAGNSGSIIEFRQANSLVGTIGEANGRLHIIGDDTGLIFAGDSNHILPCNENGANRDNAIDLGTGNVRFQTLFATTSSINTSDKNDKQDIQELNDAEKRVAVVAKSLLRKYRWKDAVALKGDKARIHFGIMAQDLQDAFTAESLDASRYGMFCSDTWWEKEISVDAVEADEANGIEAKDAYTYIDDKQEATEGYTERTRLGVRYSELLAFIISAI